MIHGDTFFGLNKFESLYGWELIIKFNYSNSLAVLNGKKLFLEPEVLASQIVAKPSHLLISLGRFNPSKLIATDVPEIV
jgi:hypothetical protein